MGMLLKQSCGAVIVVLLSAHLAAAPAHFAYVSDRRIITVESVSETEAVLNVVNLSEDVMVLHPYDLLLRVGSATHLGHAFERDKTEGPDPFFATRLLKPREFAGLTVRGSLTAAPETAVFRSAARYFLLERLQAAEFDVLEKRINEIDLKAAEGEKALRSVGINQGFGELQNYPEGETEALERLFPEIGQALPPTVIVRRDPRATHGLPADAEVEVRGLVSRKGELLDASVASGISAEADQRALNVIRNSWHFLPAIRDGDVVESTVTLRVKFVPE